MSITICSVKSLNTEISSIVSRLRAMDRGSEQCYNNGRKKRIKEFSQFDKEVFVMKSSLVKKTIAAVALICLLLAVISGSAFAEEGFSLRGGIRFGMSPDEVIEIEKSNGYDYDLNSNGEKLYESDYSYQLYYQSCGGQLGNLSIFRFEYDFDLADKKMYQFYYVFKGQDAYSYLYEALTKKYGAADNSIPQKTETFSRIQLGLRSSSRWAVPDGDNIVVIDLWDNEYNTCFLAYQPFNSQKVMEEDESLDFGL